MLVALQTVAVAMDQHKFYQSDDAISMHVSESAQLVTATDGSSDHDSTNSQSDCSHYCQCHSLVKFFKNPSDDLDKKMASIKLSYIDLNYSSISTLLFLPPPIS